MSSNASPSLSAVRCLVAERHGLPLATLPEEAFELLGGGYSNLVWRVRLPSGTVIVKQSPPQLASDPGFALPASRGVAEHAAQVAVTRWLDAQPAPGPAWRVPRPLWCAPEKDAFAMEDVLETDRAAETVLDVLRAGQDGVPLAPAVADALGDALAGFVRDLPRALSSTDGLGLPHWYCNGEMDELMASLRTPASIAARLTTQGVAEGIAEHWALRAAEAFSRSAERTSLAFGDFWPNSVFVGGGSNALLSGRDRVQITVFDWECHKRGHPAEDVAQFLANLYLMRSSSQKLFDKTAVDRVARALVLGLSRMRASGDCGDGENGFDTPAMIVFHVATLIIYPHWGIAGGKEAQSVVASALRNAETWAREGHVVEDR
ncbi:kinase-like domain-containing protein [Hyaloraphidium curvatum]|nr:kinase-like domain-containing protein [Hyaloraphidium curvatum]